MIEEHTVIQSMVASCSTQQVQTKYVVSKVNFSINNITTGKVSRMHPHL